MCLTYEMVRRNVMIHEHDLLRKDGKILLGISLGNAVLDIVTDDERLRACIGLLKQPHRGMIDTAMGMFGVYAISLVVDADDGVSICADGPDFEPHRNQCAMLCFDKDELLALLESILQED